MRVQALLLISVLPACQLFIADETPEDTRSGFHDVTVNWHLRNLDGSVMASCPPGFTTLVTHLYQDGYVEPPDALVVTPCTPEGSLTQPTATAGILPIEDYVGGAAFPYGPQKDIWMDLTEQTQLSIAASSYQYYVANLDGDLTIDFDIYPEGGVGVAAWSLFSGLTDAPLPTCDAAGVDTIEAGVRINIDTEAPFRTVGSWPCTAVDPYFYWHPDGQGTLLNNDGQVVFDLGSGHTEALPPGDYEVELRAKRGDAVVGTATGYFSAEEGNSYHHINSDRLTITDR